MSDYFKEIPHITFEGKESQNPLSFKYYDSEKIVLGKKTASDKGKTAILLGKLFLFILKDL